MSKLTDPVYLAKQSMGGTNVSLGGAAGASPLLWGVPLSEWATYLSIGAAIVSIIAGLYALYMHRRRHVLTNKLEAAIDSGATAHDNPLIRQALDSNLNETVRRSAKRGKK